MFFLLASDFSNNILMKIFDIKLEIFCDSKYRVYIRNNKKTNHI